MRASPSPDGLMVFDGGCNLCSGTVRLVTAIDRGGTIRFTAAQSPYGQALCRASGVDPDDPTTFLFFDHGRALGASEAILAMLARLPPPWRWLRVLAVVPRPLCDATYRWIAGRRYRLFGRRRTCMVPSVALRTRFIDIDPAAE